jgi:hypothetical protein
MMTIGAIGFLQPWVLAALAALPAIWWLLRLTPPSPQVVVFPPTRLLKDLKTTEETPAHSPWWLTALRMLLAALLIFALARPVLNPDQQSFAGEGPLLLVIDNGWASAAHWPERREAIEAAIERAGRDGRTVVLAFTAPGQPISDPMSPEQARERVGGMLPEPYAPDRAALAAALEKQLGGTTDYSVLWLSDGLDYGEGDVFAKTLAKLAGSSGSFAMLRPGQDDAALALSQSSGDKGELAARIMSAEGARSGVVKALTGRGEPLGEAAFSIGQNKREATANFDLPLEIRNQVARIEIAGERSAGAVHLLDGRSQWHRVGIVSGESREAAQPLLSPLYYVQRALSPYADVITPSEGNVANAIHSLIEQRVSTIVLADIGKLVAGTQEELEAWLKSGGVLIRFAGPRLEQGGDELLPVALRRGGRSLGGSLSWSTPQPLAPFEEQSPFRGLALPEDVKINRQVLADPTVASESEVWATLADGTPLVTASKQGQGFIVLFHVTANSDWSNLPLSVLFVEMLRRVVALGPSQVTIDSGKQASTVEAAPSATPAAAASTSALPPLQTLDGFGQLGSPPLRAAPIAPDKIDTLVPGPDHPPGYYGPSGAARAFNLITAKTVLKPLGTVEGSSAIGGYTLKKPMALEPWLYLAAIGLFVLDILAMLVLSGGVRLGRRAAATSAALLLALALLTSLSDASHAQDTPAVPPPVTAPQASDATASPTDFALKASLQTHLAYVVTGDPEIDRTSEEGLNGLSKVLRARTALEPAEPMGVDIDKDDLSFFPLLYWPVREDAEALSDATLAKVDAFMKQGGLIVFDTRDHETGFSGAGAQAKALTRLIGQLDIPPLEPVPESHVLTKSFYLMHSFPGRWDGGSLWVEAEPQDETERSERSRRTDGVSSIVITSNDFAAAWALDDSNRPIYPTVPGGEVQREMAFRAGVNIVMYALTGNYKADQVHVPALLERLGQ